MWDTSPWHQATTHKEELQSPSHLRFLFHITPLWAVSTPPVLLFYQQCSSTCPTLYNLENMTPPWRNQKARLAKASPKLSPHRDHKACTHVGGGKGVSRHCLKPQAEGLRKSNPHNKRKVCNFIFSLLLILEYQVIIRINVYNNYCDSKTMHGVL